jgi:hypothetical protein
MVALMVSDQELADLDTSQLDTDNDMVWSFENVDSRRPFSLARHFRSRRSQLTTEPMQFDSHF